MPDNVVNKELTLLAISGATELETGDYVVRLDFGELLDNTTEIANRLQVRPDVNPLSMKKVAANTLILFLKLEHAKPFSVGSKWKLSIDEIGRITLDGAR